MEPEQIYKIGMRTEANFQVQEHDTAVHIGSGSLRVLATPSMIAFIEQTARIFMDGPLSEEYSSVGVHVDMGHLAATPVGGNLKIDCEVVEISGRTVNFQVQVWDDAELVGEGFHRRAVIEVSRFMHRVQNKAQRIKPV